MSELLAHIKIASPCHARWDDMTGDARSRFCGQCEKQVYNFSAMTVAEAENLIRTKEGKLCGRFYRRKDGMMLTANCPVGAKAFFFRVKTLLATGGALLLTSFGVMAWNPGADRSRGPFGQKCEAVVWTVKGWLGLNPPVILMGEIVCPPSTPKVPAPLPASSNPAPEVSGKVQP